MKYVIPARRNSSVKFKNRQLLKYTLSQLPSELHKDVIVSSDDEWIKEKITKEYPSIFFLNRDQELSKDVTPIKPVIENIISQLKLPSTENICLLYLVYPHRTQQQLRDIVSFYENNNLTTLLSKKEININSYTLMHELENNRGKPVLDKNLYQRQHSPKLFQYSHFYCLFSVSELPNLSLNLYNEKTYFYKLKHDILDVDTIEDLNLINE